MHDPRVWRHARRRPPGARVTAVLAPAPVAWHTRSLSDSVRELGSDLARGLTSTEAARRLAADGPNTVAAPTTRSALAMLANQFRSLMVALLVVAGGIALGMGDVIEALAIAVVIVLNAAIGFATERKAAGALARLRSDAVLLARVRRDGHERELPAQALVPGDVVLVAAGDRVPADGRVFEDALLEVDEATLTGESLPVGKSAGPVGDRDAAIGDRSSMLYMGTAITSGRGGCLVTTTGAHTEMGKIGTLLARVDERRTPLEAKLAQLSRALLVVVLVLCAVIVVAGLLRGNGLLSMIEIGISLAIAAVPEGLLAVTTMTLAVGMQRMVKMNALVRRLPAVEALGSTTVICSDKTGTLTRNEMTVRAYEIAGRHIDVSGIGYAVDGEFRVAGEKLQPLADDAAGRALQLALRIGALCNDARIDRSGGRAVVLGDPTEAALVVAAEKAGMPPATLERAFPRIAELPFSSDRKLMVTVHRPPGGPLVAYVKGAPAPLLEASVSILGASGITAMDPAARAAGRATNDKLAASALRVLGLAYRELPEDHRDEDLTRALTFVGFVGMIDPLRAGARATIATCRAAGIRVIMITGDQQATAAEIARQLGLDVDARGNPLQTVHARELNGLDAEGWKQVVAKTAVFARASPEHKLKIVEALQRQGQVVAMTGDGVNDAPALRAADIGVAMGIRGTEVAKASADLIVTDDNFATIVRAVEQGRIIVNNILRFIHYLFSSNLSEIATVFGAVMLGWPLPVGVLQILWLNLVTDIFPAMALALEPSAPDVMRRPPRDPRQPLMTPGFAWLIVWQGLVICGCTLVAFRIAMRWYGTEGAGLRHAVTVAFMTLALAEVFHAFNARSQTRSAFTSGLFTNRWLWGATALCLLLQLAAVTVPALREVLRTVWLAPCDWALVAACSLAPVAVVEVVKLVRR